MDDRRASQGQDREARYLLVRTGPVRCAVPLASVRQVLRELTVHPVPGADPLLLGLGQHGGEAMAVLDLQRLVGVEDTSSGKHRLAVLVVVGPAGSEETVALAVDDAEDIVVIPNGRISEAREGAVRGEAEVGPHVVRVIDPAAVGAA